MDTWIDIEDQNGTMVYTGGAGDVIYGRSTFAVAEIFMVPFVYELMDYIIHLNMYMHYKSAKPKPVAPYWNFGKPFAMKTWYVIFVTLGLAAITFCLLLHFGQSEEDVVKKCIYVLMSQLSQGKIHNYI